jgi:dynein heavy chain
LTKVTLINFTITPEAAKDQMLSILSKEEDEALENEKIRLMGENADNKKKMAYVEKVILDLMSKT